MIFDTTMLGVVCNLYTAHGPQQHQVFLPLYAQKRANLSEI